MLDSETQVVPCDYDTDPERFRTNTQAAERYGLSGSLHELVAERLAAEHLQPILDIGCGEGRLVHPIRLRGMTIVAFDYSLTMLSAVPEPRVQGNATALPFRIHSFAAVAALYMLYHLASPRRAIAESYRVFHPGGLFVACAPSRHNDPELASVLPASPLTTFDAESSLAIVEEFFPKVEVER